MLGHGEDEMVRNRVKGFPEINLDDSEGVGEVGCILKGGFDGKMVIEEMTFGQATLLFGGNICLKEGFKTVGDHGSKDFVIDI